MLQYVEFSGFDANDEDGTLMNGNDDDDDVYLPSPDPHKANNREGKSLETLLATKNKRLQEGLTKLRVCTLLFINVFSKSDIQQDPPRRTRGFLEHCQTRTGVCNV